MTPREQLETKYRAYHEQGLAIFSVTLSTYVRERRVVPTEMFREMWDNHFIHRVRKVLPTRVRLDHDFGIELSPLQRRNGQLARHYHYHGFLALEPSKRHRIWIDGKLNKQLDGALRSFGHAGKYRSFCINSYDIQPAGGDGAAWASYITKDPSTQFSFA